LGGRPSTYNVFDASEGRGIVSRTGLAIVSIDSWSPNTTPRPFGARSGLICPERPMRDGSPIGTVLPSEAPEKLLASPGV